VKKLFITLFLFFIHFNLIPQPISKISTLQVETNVIKYVLKFDIDSNNKNIYCSAKIKAIKSPFNKSSLELDFYDNFFIEKIKSDNQNLNYQRSNKKLYVDISLINSDTIEIEIIYKGKPKKFGLEGFVFAQLNNQKIVQTINQPSYAPSWFPCDDDPSDKALLEIEIINDSNFVAVSNGKLIEEKVFDKKKSYKYITLYPVATNLIGIYLSNYLKLENEYRTIKGNLLDIVYFIFPQDSHKAIIDLSDTEIIINTFENLFGEYPFVGEKLSISEILYGRGAIENQTMIGIGKELFSGKKFHRDVLVHEIAHSWWGNAIGIASWNDVWLSEGFATYSEVLFYEWNFGKQASINYLNNFLQLDLSGKIFHPSNLFGNNVYYKSAWIIHMIRNLISDSVFFNFIRDYYSHYKYKSVSTSEFKQFLENYTRKDFTKFFDQWIFEDNGIIHCTFDFNETNGQLHITQKNFLFDFIVDIKVIYDDNSSINFNTEINTKEKIIHLKNHKNIKEILFDPKSKLLAKFERIK
jgi:aminopeptidase N